MIETQIVGKQQIEKLIEDVKNNEKLIKEILKMMAEGKQISENQQLAIKYSMIAYVVSSAIPKEYFDRIIIKIKKHDVNDGNQLGCFKKEDKKYCVTYNSFDFSFKENVNLSLISLSTFGHEIRHIRQIINAENGVLDIVTLMFSLEEILHRYLDNYYSENYSKLFMEVEADLCGNIYTKGYFEKYGKKESFLEKFVEYMSDLYKPEWRNYKDYEYIKNHVKDMILLINDNPSVSSQVYMSNLKTLIHVMDGNGKIYSPEHFEKELINNDFTNDSSNYLFSKKAFYELLKDISNDLENIKER